MESAVGIGGHQTPYLPALEKIVPVSEGLGRKRNAFDEVIVREGVEENQSNLVVNREAANAGEHVRQFDSTGDQISFPVAPSIERIFGVSHDRKCSPLASLFHCLRR